MRGHLSHLTGLSAEQAVAEWYRQSGYRIREERWRGPGGEIDLIVCKDSGHVFVEVKKSRDFAAAAARFTTRQQQRIINSALAYLGMQPEGLDTPMRFDVALVDFRGSIEIVENAFP